VRWCYGGRRWSCGGEEGEEGELELHGRRTVSGGGRATLTVEKLATAEAATAATARLGQRCVAPSDRGARTRLVRAAAAHARQRSAERASTARLRSGGAGCAVGTWRRPNSVLTRAVSAARGGHAGPVRRATADKWDPLVSDF
jgi:hypothetical protein